MEAESIRAHFRRYEEVVFHGPPVSHVRVVCICTLSNNANVYFIVV